MPNQGNNPLPTEAALASPAPFLLQKYYYHSHQPESGWCELLVILFWNQFTMTNDAKSTPTKISAPRKTFEATDSCSIPAQFCFNAVFPFLSGWRAWSLCPRSRGVVFTRTYTIFRVLKFCFSMFPRIFPWADQPREKIRKRACFHEKVLFTARCSDLFYAR